jgi:hypothetical protein
MTEKSRLGLPLCGPSPDRAPAAGWFEEPPRVAEPAAFDPVGNCGRPIGQFVVGIGAGVFDHPARSTQPKGGYWAGS